MTPTCSGEGIAKAFEEAAHHWAYRPLKTPEIPKVRSVENVRSPVDAFLLAPLEANGLGFSPKADPRTLLRRVYFDLIGIPPTYAEIEAFTRDTSPGAWAAVVDRLLNDPRYGERWGRHWLDVARYADTKDLVLLYGKDAIRPYAYTYRDYVIRAFNEDMPFDVFVRDQIAADLVEPKVPSWRLAALGFLTLGRLFDQNPHDQIDDQIDTVGRGLLGLTVACARCHDHKFDAITMEDYYGLYGVFASTERPYLLPLIEDPSDVPGGPEFEEKLAKATGELERHIDAEYSKLTEVFRLRLGDYLERAVTTPPDITETTQFFLSLTPDDFRPGLMLRTRRYLARRARPEDPVFGPWAAAMAALSSEVSPAEGVGIPDRRVVDALESAPERSEWNPLAVAALRQARPVEPAAVARAYGALFRSVYEESRAGQAEEGAKREILDVVIGRDGPVAFERRETPNHMSRPEKDRYGGLVLALDKLGAHATQAPPARAMVVTDLPERHASRVFLRGNPSRPERPAPQGFLQVLGDGEARRFEHGSGRLELAEAIGDPGNPLTARVFMNRVWMHHFGEPLVASPGDFGARSDPPSHPELLDWLAHEFVSAGWRLKPIHRRLLLSAAFQQGFIPSADSKGEEIDPDNRLLWRFPRRRLDVEAMRDSLLAISGRLESTVGGRPVDDRVRRGEPATDGLWADRPSEPARLLSVLRFRGARPVRGTAAEDHGAPAGAVRVERPLCSSAGDRGVPVAGDSRSGHRFRSCEAPFPSGARPEPFPHRELGGARFPGGFQSWSGRRSGRRERLDLPGAVGPGGDGFERGCFQRVGDSETR